MRCAHREWKKVEGTQGNRVQCANPACGILGHRKAWGGFKSSSRKVILYRCPCGRIARYRVWRGTHENFACKDCKAAHAAANEGKLPAAS